MLNSRVRNDEDDGVIVDPKQKQPGEKSALVFIWLTILIVIADLVTKYWASSNIEYGRAIYVLPFFDLTLLHNPGAAFSFLADAGGWQRWFFTAISAGVSVMLAVWLYRLPSSQKWLGLALALILGGALGNLYDRVTLGYVVDFLSFHGSFFQAVMGSERFPAFNIADAAISVGAVMMIIDVIKDIIAEKKDSDNDEKIKKNSGDK